MAKNILSKAYDLLKNPEVDAAGVSGYIVVNAQYLPEDPTIRSIYVAASLLSLAAVPLLVKHGGDLKEAVGKSLTNNYERLKNAFNQ